MNMSAFDAILVPGGGVREGGNVPPWTKARLDLALRISKNEPIITLSAGTVHRAPVLDGNGFPVFESVAAARYLMEMGVKPDRILTETCSYDTIGNAYFSRVIHIEPGDLRRLLIITSEFHLARTEQIFLWVYSLDHGGDFYQLTFRSVPDIGIPAAALKARKKKEKESLEQFFKTRESIASLKQLHGWLHTRHAAYSAARRPLTQAGDILETY
jgi:hypothetical protein